MSIENERLRLVPHKVLASPDGTLVVALPDGNTVDVPKSFAALFQLVQNGSSLEMLALALRASPGSGRFALLAAFFSFLAEAGLLADRAAIRMAEAMKPDYRWRQSLAFEELVSFELGRLPKGRPIAQGVVALICLAFGALCVGRFLNQASLDADQVSGLQTVTPALIAFIVVFTFGRSLRAVVQSVATRLVTGAESGLRIRLDLVSASLASDDISRGRGGPALLAAGAGCLLVTASPVILISAFPGKLHPVFATYFTIVLLFADFSPLARSPLTEWLRALYNFMDRRASGGGQGSAESLMKFIHVAATVVWTAALGLFVAFPTYELVLELKTHLAFDHRATQVGAGLLGLALAVIVVSFLDDLRSAVEYGEGNDRRLIRRIWRRSIPQLPVDEAIQQGKAPSRRDLEALPILRQLDAETRAGLLSRARLAEIAEGGAVCRQGAKDRSLFILLAGRLAVVKQADGRRRRVVAMLEPGSVFGEAAYFFGTSRTADVVALEPSRVLEIRHDPAMKTMETQRSEELQLRIWFLQALVSGSFLKNLPSEALDAVIFAGQRHVVQAGQSVMREGLAGDACYFLIQGQASVTQQGKLINRMKAGDAFGEIALLRPGSPRTATVIADSDLLTVRIESEAFWKLLANHLPLAIEIERLAEQRIADDRRRHLQVSS